jgi:hypothetical protein
MRLVAVVLAVLALAPAAADARELEVPLAGGALTRIEVPDVPQAPLPRAEAEALAASDLVPLAVAGPSENRFDLVIVGDGYTAAEQDRFLQHARAQWDAVRTTPPFDRYVGLFNVWAVRVASAESGVDNDPRPPAARATALDMGFWCQGIERALCVDERKARAAAGAAPEADQVLALANSTKYGGVGGTVATASGGSSAAALITVHELGHTLGKLADEYDYYARAGLSEDSTQDVTIPVPFLVYPAALGEPARANTTAISSPEAMRARQAKWWRWLGEPAAEGGVVGTYEGSGTYRFGQFRPTPDSLMHTLGILKGGNAFNAPSAEALVAETWRRVTPIDEATPEGRVTPGTTLRVRPVLDALDVVWSVDGRERPEARGARSFTVPQGAREVTATVVDATPLVRDERLREEAMTAVLTWSTSSGAGGERDGSAG